MMKGQVCRDARRALMVGWIRKNTEEMKFLMDHLLECRECQAWAKSRGALGMIKEIRDEKLKGLHCPACLEPMKVNFDFKVAKCMNCDWTLDWSSPITMSMSILKLTEITARRKGIKLDSLPILH